MSALEPFERLRASSPARDRKRERRFRSGRRACCWLAGVAVVVAVAGVVVGALGMVFVASVGSVVAHTMVVMIRHDRRARGDTEHGVESAPQHSGDPRWN